MLHSLAVVHTKEMETAVDKEMSKARADGYAHLMRLAFGLADVEKYLTGVFVEGEGKDVGGVILIPIRYVDSTSELVTANDEGEVVLVA